MPLLLHTQNLTIICDWVPLTPSSYKTPLLLLRLPVIYFALLLLLPLSLSNNNNKNDVFWPVLFRLSWFFCLCIINWLTANKSYFLKEVPIYGICVLRCLGGGWMEIGGGCKRLLSIKTVFWIGSSLFFRHSFLQPKSSRRRRSLKPIFARFFLHFLIDCTEKEMHSGPPNSNNRVVKKEREHRPVCKMPTSASQVITALSAIV